MNMIKPKPLRRGDTIGLVGISGALHEPETRFEKMLEAIDALGYKVIVADSCREEYGYLSGTDASRAKGLNQMFRDDRVDAVVCMRGGYGVTRILDRVDFDVIRANPKLLLGYSDITALHTAIHEKVGMVTIHAVEVTPDYAHAKVFFSVLVGDPHECEAALNEAAGFLRNSLFKRLQIHTVPTLHFVFDRTTERAAELNLLIQQANATRAKDD